MSACHSVEAGQEECVILGVSSYEGSAHLISPEANGAWPSGSLAICRCISHTWNHFLSLALFCLPRSEVNLRQLTTSMEKSVIDSEAKEAIDIRFIQGYSRKETIMSMRRGVASSIVDRRIEAGIEYSMSISKTNFDDDLTTM